MKTVGLFLIQLSVIKTLYSRHAWLIQRDPGQECCQRYATIGSILTKFLKLFKRGALQEITALLNQQRFLGGSAG